jgi:hypothetical protein
MHFELHAQVCVKHFKWMACVHDPAQQLKESFNSVPLQTLRERMLIEKKLKTCSDQKCARQTIDCFCKPSFDMSTRKIQNVLFPAS